MKIKERLQKPVPDFFKKVRTAGIILAAAGGALLAAPVMFPAIVLQVGGYMLATGTVITAICQATVVQEPDALRRLRKGNSNEPTP